MGSAAEAAHGPSARTPAAMRALTFDLTVRRPRGQQTQPAPRDALSASAASHPTSRASVWGRRVSIPLLNLSMAPGTASLQRIGASEGFLVGHRPQEFSRETKKYETRRPGIGAKLAGRFCGQSQPKSGCLRFALERDIAATVRSGSYGERLSGSSIPCRQSGITTRLRDRTEGPDQGRPPWE